MVDVKKLIMPAIMYILANFIYQKLTFIGGANDMALAFDRSYFQATILIFLWFFYIRK